MPQMAATIGTGDFCAHAIGVERALHRTSDFIIKTRPAAMCIKLIFRPIQRRVALSADKHACPVFVQQIASKWQLGAFVEDDAFFFIGESIHTSSIRLDSSKRREAPLKFCAILYIWLAENPADRQSPPNYSSGMLLLRLVSWRREHSPSLPRLLSARRLSD